MAGLEALSLTCNVLRLLDTTGRVFSAAREKYESATGLSQDDEALLRDTEDLMSLFHRINDDRTRHSHLLDAKFQQLAHACQREATELIQNLKDLGVGDGKLRSGESLRKAWRDVVGKGREKVEQRAARLQDIQQGLVIYLIAALGDEQKSVSASIKGLQLSNDMLEAKTMSKLNDLHLEVLGMKSSGEDAFASLKAHIESMTAEAGRVQHQQAILRSLTFSTIQQRQQAIANSHAETFRWILQSEQSVFAEWLARDEGFFWITGKPGSGKSTLMKFLATSPATQQELEEWGGERRVVFAHFYFWLAGSPMQKSLSGLWQSLLYQILKDCPELIETLCPERWKALMNGKECSPWHDQELLATMQLIAGLHSLPLKFCFFIDGLDEYTAGGSSYEGTYEELIKPIEALAESPYIKVCVSSRSWNFFEKPWGKKKMMLRLEDCTQSDIRQYVTDKLSSDAQFMELAESDERFNNIPNTVVEMAEGVFLWVYLVVASLRRGLTHEDTYENLERRLRLLPRDLNDLFRRILNNIDDVYQEESHRILRVMCAAQEALPLTTFKFLEQAIKTPDSIINERPKEQSLESMEREAARLRTRVNACCQDFLSFTENRKEVPAMRHQVDFMHRTIRDFLLLPESAHLLEAGDAASDFDPRMALCTVVLALIKVTEGSRAPARLNLRNTDASRGTKSLFKLVDRLMYLARRVEMSVSGYAQDGVAHGSRIIASLGKVLDELDRFLSDEYKRSGVHWSSHRALTNQPQSTVHPTEGMRERVFLMEAIRAGLATYVRRRITPELIQKHHLRSLLDYALRPSGGEISVHTLTAGGPIAPMVRLLLELGVDPNATMSEEGGKTPWECFLESLHLRQSYHMVIESSPALVNDMAATLELMISAGADTKRKISVDGRGPMRAIDLLGVPGLPSWRAESIKALALEKQRG